jgi:transposase
VIDAVAGMDLAAFYGAYRADGHGRAAYEPSMIVTLVLYAYATKQRSSRAIESHCRQDVAYRVLHGFSRALLLSRLSGYADSSHQVPACACSTPNRSHRWSG